MARPDARLTHGSTSTVIKRVYYGTQFRGVGTLIARRTLRILVYEAMWLRERKARWAEELGKKYAQQFPPSEPSGAA